MTAIPPSPLTVPIHEVKFVACVLELLFSEFPDVDLGMSSRMPLIIGSCHAGIRCFLSCECVGSVSLQAEEELTPEDRKELSESPEASTLPSFSTCLVCSCAR